jgi:hypothetical protein
LAGRTPAEAVQNYLDPLQRAVSCITDEVINVSGGYYVRDKPHLATLGRGLPVRLRAQQNLALILSQHYRIVEGEGERGPWKVQTTRYLYQVQADGSEYLSYHWHPEGLSDRVRPHVHLALDERRRHFPTGRVAAEDVIRLLIEDLDVEPRRSDWREILDETQAAFETWRTWG